MKVTRIEEVSKSRRKIYIEDEFAFVLYKGELRLYHICEGEEIQQSDYEKIMTEVLPKRAKLRAMNLLKSREYTVKQLSDKLKQGDYPQAVIDEALAYVDSFHYTDDLRYARDYIVCNESKRSRRRIEQDLMGKGISSSIIENAFAEWEQLGGTQDEWTMIQALMEKKHYEPDVAQPKEMQRMYAFLMRKGFSADMIQKALRK